MYLYLGQDTVISDSDVLGIFDLENTSVSKETKAFLKNAQKSGHIREVSPDLPKSFVVCDRKGKKAVYLSQISPSTLKKRTKAFKEM